MMRFRWWLALAACFGLGIIVGLLAAKMPIGLASATQADEPRRHASDRPTVPPDDGKLRILCFGAHPDDCELQAGGVALLWAAQGDHDKFVSLTNGDMRHMR